MSSMLMAAAAAVAAAAGPPPPPPTPPTITAEQALANAKATYGTPVKPRETCPEGTGGEIVVCAYNVDPATQHVPSDTDNGATDDGIPRAPDVSGLPPCINAGLAFCAQHLGRQPRQLYIIDLKAIPEAPPGSDADKIAKGEMAAP